MGSNRESQPPRIALRFLEWFCPPALYEGIEGDLMEEFERDISDASDSSERSDAYRRAQIKFIWNVIRFFRPGIIMRHRITVNIKSPLMLNNYIKVGLRNLWKNRSFSFINITGLAISLSLCLMIISVIVEQLSYDRFHLNRKNIYRIKCISHEPEGAVYKMATAPAPLADYLREQVSGIGSVVTLKSRLGGDMRGNDKILPFQGLYATGEFFDVFSFSLISGNRKTALEQPHSILLTQTTAQKFFGDRDPLGEVMNLPGVGELTVTGVMKDVPANSSLKFEGIVSFATVAVLEKSGSIYATTDNWQNLNDNYVYFTVNDNAALQGVEESLASIAKKRYTKPHEQRISFEVHPFIGMDADEEYGNEIAMKVPGLALLAMGGIGLVILLSACFNYTNLSIARALTRAREVGIRKVSGAHRSQVFFQFITESVVIVLLSLLCAMALMWLTEPLLRSVLDKEITQVLYVSYRPEVFVWFLVFGLLTGILAGLLPAVLLSRFSPAQALKTISGIKLLSGLDFRKALIVFQFALSLIFIVTILTFNEQLKFSLSRDPGFDKENMVNINIQGENHSFFEQAYKALPEVENISMSAYVPATGNHWANFVRKPGTADSSTFFFYLSANEKFIPNFGLSVVAGRNFSAGSEDAASLILNEQAIKDLGFNSPLDAIDQTLIFGRGENQRELRIVGVVKDFSFYKIDTEIKMLGLINRPEWFEYINLRVNAPDRLAFVQKLEAIWKENVKDHPFRHQWLDDQMKESVSYYVVFVKLLGYVAFLAMTLACLGLLGMAIYTAQMKIREIGIRKVFGAGEWQLVLQLSKGFIYLLLIASFIATPVAYLLNKSWLDGLAYKTSLGPGIFLLGLFIMLAIGLVIIVSQTWRAALTNPVKTLRSE